MSATLTSAARYLARGSGVTGLVLFSVVVALGVASRAGRPVAGLPRFAVPSTVARDAERTVAACPKLALRLTRDG